MNVWDKRLLETKIKIDRISSTFCAAKWLQVTLHLQTGQTHSCHHPDTHTIPLDDLQQHPASLHNTPFKKEMRRMMQEGTRPPECEYCWRAEDVTMEKYSDRYIKSADEWAFPYIDEIATMPWDHDIIPTYLEVSFGSECNLRCAYCAPHSSRSIHNEYIKHGDYPTTHPLSLQYLQSSGKLPLTESPNPYIEAFWKWFPNIVDRLHVFRITGGEPLLNENTFRILDYFDQHPHPNLELSINSNLCVSETRFATFLRKCKKLTTKNKVKALIVFTSVDTHGAHAEYIRFGLNYERLMSNSKRFLELSTDNRVRLVFMCTFNILSLPHFTNLLNDILELKKIFIPKVLDCAKIAIDVSTLNYPEYLSASIAPQWAKEKLVDAAAFGRTHYYSWEYPHGFDDYELNKIERLRDSLLNPSDNDAGMSTRRKDFGLFITEYDRRKKTNFRTTFPEYDDFLNQCLSLQNEQTESPT